jgi:hypothetical protein
VIFEAAIGVTTVAFHLPLVPVSLGPPRLKVLNGNADTRDRSPPMRADSVVGATQIGPQLMSEPYRQCVACGKRALEFATRCPGCGTALPNPAPFEPDATPELGRFLSVKVVIALVATGTLLASLQHRAARAAPVSTETSFVTAVSSERPAMERVLPVVPVTTTAAAPGTGAASVSLVAKGWTNVRSRRSVNASLEAVLTPGDTVVADSLANGWYRVALYGEVLGYARQSTLSPIR